MIILPALLLVALGSAQGATTPDSCYWCVSTGQTWDYANSLCSKTGNLITTAAGCSDNLDLKGLEYIISLTYDGGKNTTFNGTAIVGTFKLPLNNIETSRDIIFSVLNMQAMLDLQMRVNCDSSSIVGYQMLSNDLYKDILKMKMTTSPFKCGDKVKIESNHWSWIVLIQNEGSSKVDYELATYVNDNVPIVSPTVAGVIGGVIGAVSVLLIVLGIFIYKKCADRKLAEKLKHDSSQRPLV